MWPTTSSICARWTSSRRQPLLGTEGSDPTGPFFSPDGQWIGFFTNRDYALKKVALAGGAAVTLAQTPGAASASWGADDTIVFGAGDILRVAGAGGTPEVLVRYQTAGAIAVFPQMLPGGEAVLYTRTSVSGAAGSAGAWDAAQIVVAQVATGERTVMIEGASMRAMCRPGIWSTRRAGRSWRCRSMSIGLEMTGDPVPVVEGISRAGVGAANADIARTGGVGLSPE